MTSFEKAVELLCGIPGVHRRTAEVIIAERGLTEAAMASVRSKDTYLAAPALYARLRPRRGHKKALGAVKHSILVACWHMLTTGELYNDLGGDYCQRRDPERITKRLVARLEALGQTVILEAVAA